jgi:hypothetical protein
MFPVFIKIIALIKQEIKDKIIIIRANNNKREFGLEFGYNIRKRIYNSSLVLYINIL